MLQGIKPVYWVWTPTEDFGIFERFGAPSLRAAQHPVHGVPEAPDGRIYGRRGPPIQAWTVLPEPGEIDGGEF